MVEPGFFHDPLSFQSFRVYDRCSYERDNKSLIEKLVVQAKNTITVRMCVCRGGSFVRPGQYVELEVNTFEVSAFMYRTSERFNVFLANVLVRQN